MDKTLVILAAGMGSRFGGLKQIEPVGPNGEIIADYSVYDAIKVGFTKVVFVIKRENYEYFKEHITSKYAKKIKVKFAFQSLDDIPGIPQERTKMLGTGHALYVAKDKVKEPFVMINADDFYGRDSYQKGYDFITSNKNENEYLSVNYPYINSTTLNGKVNRGVVSLDNNNNIQDIAECSIEMVDKEIKATRFSDHTTFNITEDTPVCMNFLALKPSIFTFLTRDLENFLKQGVTIDNEFLLPDVLKNCVNNKEIIYKSVMSQAKWFGMTYREDIADLKQNILKLIDAGLYPARLWEE